MTNLFSIFDPATSTNLSLNWLSLFLGMILLPTMFWKTQSRLTKPFNALNSYLLKEFNPLLKKNPGALLIMISMFSFIMLNNVLGLLPYIFTSTSHMTISVALALPMWLGMMMHGWAFNTSSLLIHLVPKNTPLALMPFMVLIETISNIIRPLTLAIRLAANMIAGHLLITLLTSVTPFTPALGLPILLTAQVSLNALETAVAFIQAYVFSVLITLYASESIS